MERDSTFKEHHFFELQRRESLNNGLSLLVGIVALLASGAVTMCKGLSLDGSASDMFLSSALILTAGALSVTVICMIVSIFGYTYAYFPDTNELLRTRGEFITYHSNGQEAAEDARKVALDDFAQEIERIYAQNASMNGATNDKRSRWVFFANRAVVVSLALFAVSGGGYLANTIGATEKPVRVLINNLE